MPNRATSASLVQLLQLTEALHDTRGLDQYLTFLIEQAIGLPGVDTVRILLIDETGTRLMAQAAVGFPELAGEEHDVPVGIGFAGRIAQTRQPLLVPDLQLFPVHSPALRLAGVLSAVGVPLLIGDRLVGVMHIGSRTRNTFGADTLPLLEGIAALVALTTEAIRADQALAASEARFRELFEDAPIGACLIGLNPQTYGRLQLANGSLAALTGYDVDELQLMTFEMLVAPDHQVAARAALAAMASGERTRYTAERLLRRRDGSIIWARASVTAVLKGGRPSYAISYIEDVTRRKAAEQALAQRALTDPLTGLPNRQLVMDHLDLALRQQARTGSRVGVLYLDLDHFKTINDEHGHEAGDLMLREAARRMRAALRSGDTAGRIGGDEFVLVCPNLTGAEELAVIADRLVHCLGEPAASSGGEPVRLTASIGTALSDPDIIPAALVRRADLAMYEAKRLGRHRWHTYRPALDEVSERRRGAEQLLSQALRHEWFVLHYQPVIDLVSGATVAAEALLRIQHPVHGLLLPEAFIDVLEHSDLADPIEQWVLDQACHDLATHPAAQLLPEIAVNISGRRWRPCSNRKNQSAT